MKTQEAFAKVREAIEGMPSEARVEALAALALVERDLLMLDVLPDGWKIEISKGVENLAEGTRYFCKATGPVITSIAHENTRSKALNAAIRQCLR